MSEKTACKMKENIYKSYIGKGSIKYAEYIKNSYNSATKRYTTQLKWSEDSNRHFEQSHQ